MKSGHKPLLFTYLILVVVALASCGGTPTGSNWDGGGSGSGSGSGVGSGSGSGAGSGATYTIGGAVTGLAGTGLVIQDNGGDSLTINGTGTVNFTFATPVSGTYNVSVNAQPTNPAQTCSVSNGSGTATANVTDVLITCNTSNTLGGVVSGLLGSGLVLQNNASDNLKITGTGNVNFTFDQPLANGATYAVTVATQPKTPNQTCSVANGTGTITNGSVSSVQVSCSQPKYSVGGNVTGLVDKSADPANCTNCLDTLELQDNAGDNLFVSGDVPFTFPTQFTYGAIFSVNEFLQGASQPQGCVIFNATATVTADVSNVLVDCQHNDWAWMFPGPATVPTINTYGAASLVPPDPVAPPPYGTTNSNTPGGRDFGMTWTDKSGNRWLFGGYGFPVKSSAVNPIPGRLNDMWVRNENDWIYGGWVPADLPVVPCSSPSGVCANIAPLQIENQAGNYGSVGSGAACSSSPSSCTFPGARWGGVTWTDAAGNLWMFGGQAPDVRTSGLLNDVWEFDLNSGSCSYDLATASLTNCTWIWQAGSSVGGQPTTSTFPGGRWGAAFYQDAAGNLWMFGGQGCDSSVPIPPSSCNVGLLNDLWEHPAGSAGSSWTLISGTTLANQNGVYGTEGTAALGNIPGGRQNGVLWVDHSGNIWLFGGWGLDSAGTAAAGLGPGNAQIGAILNDLWEYNPGTGQWTWVSGSNVADQNGVYGAQGISNNNQNQAATSMPGSRWGAVGWVDPDLAGTGNLFLFGGFGYGTNATQPTGFLNDVWEFDQTTGHWVWWKGSADVDQPGTYVTTPQSFFRLGNATNAIGGRRGAAIWQPSIANDGYVFIFGGEGYAAQGGPYGDLNDLWTFLPFCSHDAPCPY